MKHKTLIENPFPLHLLLRHKLSKPLPVAFATHLQREGVLTICKSSKWLLKTPFGRKTCRKRPPNGLQSMPEGWKMYPQISFSICDHFSWALGHFPRQTRLKWAKNFKARFLSLTKCTEKGFWRFVKAGNTEKKASENPFWVQNSQKTTPKWPPKHAWRMENVPPD